MMILNYLRPSYFLTVKLWRIREYIVLLTIHLGNKNKLC